VGPSYAYSGTYSLLLDDWSNDTIYSYAAAILAVDLDSGSQTELDFWWQEFGYDRTNEGVYISDDAGGTWYQVMDFDADPTGWQHEIIDLDEAAAAAGMTLGAGFRIKFQAYLDDPITYEGYAIDEIQVRENRAPALSWLGTGNYTDDGVHPESGDVADDYEYRIKYADPEGDPPAYVRVHIEEGGVDIPGSPFTLTDDGGDYTSGVSCSYVRSGLEEGDDYTYYFVAQDDQGKAASSTPRKTGPVATVTYWAYLPTFLKNIGPPTSVPVLYPISNPNGDYRFTITWSDAKKAARYTLEQDRDAGFSSPAVAYTGAATSTQVSVGDVGTYYYRVKASNSFGETDWSNTESVVVTVAPPPCPREGYWSGTTSQGKGIRFDVVYSPRCQVESLSITYRICGMTVTADFYEDYSITDDHFYVGGGDNWLSGDFASDTEANGSFFFEMMCPGFPPIPDFSDGTWTATFKP
jgi:hypothetical protein